MNASFKKEGDRSRLGAWVLSAAAAIAIPWVSPVWGDREAPVGGDWLDRVQSDIERSEYNVTWQEFTDLPEATAGWQAPNREHGIRTYFTARGIRVVPREQAQSSWELGLALARVGRGDDLQAVGPAVLSPDRNRIDYERPGLSEWFSNEPQGLEHGLVIDRVAGDGRLSIEIEVSGTLRVALTEDGQAVRFTATDDRRVLRYSAVHVTDALGRDLAARMEAFNRAGERGVRIVVDDLDAVYPVTVDPILTGATVRWDGEQAGAHLGEQVATAGDVNGDGFSDVIVGVPLYDNGQTDEGRAYVFYGSAAGVSPTPDWTMEVNQASAQYGYAVATAGDVNGDGFSDVIVGAPLYDSGLTDQGRATVYYGSAGGLPATHNWQYTPFQAGARAGSAVGTAGDANCDGYSDVIVGVPYFNNVESDEGLAVVFDGSASGLVTTASWTAEGGQVAAEFGHAVGTAGDVNGDGCSDVIVGAPSHDVLSVNNGRAYSFLGSASGVLAVPSWIADGYWSNALFGSSVATAGDVNGDGYADVVVGAPDDSHTGALTVGSVSVFLGSAVGLSTTAARQLWGSTGVGSRGDALGRSVGTAGDWNGDGYADVLIGVPYADVGAQDTGDVRLYAGSPAGLGPQPAIQWPGYQSGGFVGWWVATAGDVDGDGYSDVVVGAPYARATAGVAEGSAWVYESDGGKGLTEGTDPDWIVTGGQNSAYLGTAVASAGDVNADGFADVIVGAPNYDNGQADEGRVFVYVGSENGLGTSPWWTAESDQAGAHFGDAVGGAGDVWGDDRADVVVGAPNWDTASYTDAGRAYLFNAVSLGLPTGPSWTREGTQSYMYTGRSVAGAGDVNGDGYADVIFGSDGYASGAGQIRVMYGAITGPGATTWSYNTSQASAYLGRSVATAGDVNGDGFDDIVAGAPYLDSGQTDEGRVYVFHGSSTGLSSSVNWMVDGNASGAHFGTSVSTAGDVNGDGYADVILGAPGYDSKGRVYVYHGSLTGLASLPNFTEDNLSSTGAFGQAVGCAGDVNGDGYSDALAGDPLWNGDQGNVHAYYGSPTGVVRWWRYSYQDPGEFGRSLAGAGDVNGDGYSDAIIGARYCGDAPYEGCAMLFYGGGGRGVTLGPRQVHASVKGDIAHLAKSDSDSSFKVRVMTARTPFGRGDVKLQWEVKHLGSLFGGTNTEAGASWQSTGTTGVLLSGTPTELARGVRYHWRERLLFRPSILPFQPAGRWFTRPWNGWQEADLCTSGFTTTDAAGRVPTGPDAPGEPVQVVKETDGDITLRWDRSCLSSDTDYEIYEGAIGDYYSHRAMFCSTEARTTWRFTPSAGGRYYLVVSRTSTREGSYGEDSRGAERPQGIPACLVWGTTICP